MCSPRVLWVRDKAQDTRAALVAGDGGVGGEGPEFDAAGDGAAGREVWSVGAEGVGGLEGADAVVAEDGDLLSGGRLNLVVAFFEFGERDEDLAGHVHKVPLFGRAHIDDPCRARFGQLIGLGGRHGAGVIQSELVGAVVRAAENFRRRIQFLIRHVLIAHQ